MDNSLKVLFNDMMKLIDRELTDISFDSFFSQLYPVALKDDTLYLRAPTGFIAEHIKNVYADKLNSIASSITGRNIKVVVQHSADETLSDTANVRKDDIESGLISKFTFENFVVGDSNRLAHAASIATAENPGKLYNPLFIYGRSGLGKTHLMHAIGNYIKERDSSKRILYVTSEKFTNEFISSIRFGNTVDFREKYRNLDILMVDDIQFIPGKEMTEVEFFHTFNHLTGMGSHIIITSDKPPNALQGFDIRLTTRFAGGLMADIQEPDLETRIAILKKKADVEGLKIPEEAYLKIAERVKTNIRDLEGALIRVTALAKINGGQIDDELVENAMAMFENNKTKTVDCNKILKTVSEHYGINVNDITGKSRARNIAYPRQIAMYIARELTDLSLPKIGAEFGGRDHTTIIHGIAKVQKDMDMDENLKQQIMKLKKSIKES